MISGLFLNGGLSGQAPYDCFGRLLATPALRGGTVIDSRAHHACMVPGLELVVPHCLCLYICMCLQKTNETLKLYTNIMPA